MKKFYSFVLAMAAMTAGAADGSYCNNYEGIKTGTDGNALRHITTVTVSCGDEQVVVEDVQSRGNTDVYVDRTEEAILEVTPGQTVTFKTTAGMNSNNDESSWMHGYLWVDWNNDYEFTPEFNGNVPADNSELVAFTYRNGYTSAGETTTDGAQLANGYKANLSFNVPEDLAYGDYRLRYIISWENTNPCGTELSDKDRLDVTGGIVFDMTLRYSDSQGTVEPVADPVVTYTIGEGGTAVVFGPGMSFVKSGDSFEKGSRVSFSITANEGKVINHLTANGVEVEAAAGQRTYAYNLIVEEDVDVQITFRGAEVLEFFPVNFTIGEGGKMAVVDMTDGRTLESGDEVLAGRNIKVSIFANNGWEILQLTINGFEMEEAVAQTSYECYRQIDKETTIAVTFKERPNSIETVGADEEEAVYYDIQGVRVANPAEGVYIKVSGNKAEKVYLRK